MSLHIVIGWATRAFRPKQFCEAGRIYCEADTYEAEGEINMKSPEREERIRIRCVLGPNGEYRLECGDKASIFDGEYLGGHMSGQYEIAYDFKRMADNVKAKGRSDMKLCRPERLGDGAMLIGSAAFMGHGAGLESMGRALGCEWMELYMRDEKCNAVHEGSDFAQGVPCFKIRIQTTEGQPRLWAWIDKHHGVLRRYERVMDQTQISVSYDFIRINHRLNDNEFMLPEEAKRRFQKKRQEEAKRSD
ncbi:MAG: hypothetical protein IPK83_13890 [Planctomycetes bacterium]|nr:hypothetical protein [Planctomycetota bacterium]